MKPNHHLRIECIMDPKKEKGLGPNRHLVRRPVIREPRMTFQMSQLEFFQAVEAVKGRMGANFYTNPMQ